MSVIYINPYSFAATDPNFADVSLLLHGDGTNGSTTITDNSPSPKTVTAVGNAQISTAQSKFGGASIALDGTGDYLSTPATNAFVFGTGDFTIEFWIRFTVVTGVQVIYDQRPVNAAFVPTIYTNNNTLNYLFNGLVAITLGTVTSAQWYHIAISKQGSSTKGFIDGTQGGSTYVDSTSYTSGPNLLIGQNSVNVNTPQFVNGYIDDLRITKGVARYTANFTPPTAAFPDI
jgi:hypothetical protein